MEQSKLKSIGKQLQKFKYPAMILLLGLLLLLWPGKNVSAPVPEEAPAETVSEEQSIQEQVERILSCMEGAGKVRVLLTKSSGDETVYQTDVTQSHSADGTESRTETTVLIDQAGGGEAPAVIRTVYGAYQGAVVACEGADRAKVRLEMVNAVASLTGLSADRITVIKMKS